MSESLTLDPDKPTAVRLFDLGSATGIIDDCAGYDRAMVFFLYQGAIVGRTILPVEEGVVSPDSLQSSVYQRMHNIGETIRESRYRATVHRIYQPSVSVVVCTCDRVPVLRDCMESLLGIDWADLEIVVVDNSIRPGETQNLIREFPSVCYVRCPQKGLNRSRNVGIRATSGEIIAFTDDDARVHTSWLKGLAANFRDPMVAVATGITLPAKLDARPAIEFEMTSPFTRKFIRKEFTLTTSDMTSVAQIGAGVNMAVRRSCLNDIGLFDEQLDGGTPTISGGDHEFFYRAIVRGYRIVYDPSAIAWHKHRETSAAAIRTVYGYGVGVLAWWTRSLIQEREFSVLLRAPITILQYYVWRVVRSLLGRPGSSPLKYSLAELRGALYGPFAYLRSIARMSE